MKKRYITLTKSERTILHDLKKEGLTERVRDRFHAILLSDKGFSVSQLSDVFDVRPATILGWYNRWETAGLGALSDHSKSGRPRIFTKAEEKNSISG